MFKFLKNLFGKKEPRVQEKKELLEPQHNVNPAPKVKKPRAPKNPPSKGSVVSKNPPKAKPAKAEEPTKRGRKPKAK